MVSQEPREDAIEFGTAPAEARRNAVLVIADMERDGDRQVARDVGRRCLHVCRRSVCDHRRTAEQRAEAHVARDQRLDDLARIGHHTEM